MMRYSELSVPARRRAIAEIIGAMLKSAPKLVERLGLPEIYKRAKKSAQVDCCFFEDGKTYAGSYQVAISWGDLTPQEQGQMLQEFMWKTQKYYENQGKSINERALRAGCLKACREVFYDTDGQWCGGYLIFPN